MQVKVTYNNQDIIDTDSDVSATLVTADKRMLSDVNVSVTGSSSLGVTSYTLSTRGNVEFTLWFPALDKSDIVLRAIESGDISSSGDTTNIDVAVDSYGSNAGFLLISDTLIYVAVVYDEQEIPIPVGKDGTFTVPISGGHYRNTIVFADTK